MEKKMNESVTTTNVYFKKLIDLVPPKAYFDAESNAILSNHSKEHESVKSVKDSNKVVGDNNNNEKRLTKKARLNPTQPTKTTQLQQILPQLKHIESLTPSVRRNSNSGGLGGSTLAVTSNGECIATDISHSSTDLTHSKKDSRNVKGADTLNPKTTKSHRKDTVRSSKISQPAEVVNNVANDNNDDFVNDSSSMPTTEGEPSGTNSDSSKVPSPATAGTKLHPEQLREKLRARILELQSKRQRGITPEEFLESKKLRRKESKLRLKQKRKEAKKLKLSIEKQAKNSQKKLNGVSEVKPDDEAKVSSNGNMVFSKFQFSEQAKKPKERKQKKPKSYKELYEKVGC